MKNISHRGSSGASTHPHAVFFQILVIQVRISEAFSFLSHFLSLCGHPEHTFLACFANNCLSGSLCRSCSRSILACTEIVCCHPLVLMNMPHKAYNHKHCLHSPFDYSGKVIYFHMSGKVYFHKDVLIYSVHICHHPFSIFLPSDIHHHNSHKDVFAYSVQNFLVLVIKT